MLASVSHVDLLSMMHFQVALKESLDTERLVAMLAWIPCVSHMSVANVPFQKKLGMRLVVALVAQVVFDRPKIKIIDSDPETVFKQEFLLVRLVVSFVMSLKFSVRRELKIALVAKCQQSPRFLGSLFLLPSGRFFKGLFMEDSQMGCPFVDSLERQIAFFTDALVRFESNPIVKFIQMILELFIRGVGEITFFHRAVVHHSSEEKTTTKLKNIYAIRHLSI